MKVLQISLSTVLCVLCITSLRYTTSDAFPMSMVTSTKASSKSIPNPSIIDSGITSGLISNLAAVALKMRLAKQSGVKVDVTAKSLDLILRGRVGPVTVTGRGWESALGLRCRAIEATVDSCELDIGRILSHQKLRLTRPAHGNAMVALNSIDFGNFITHPLMKPPGVPGKGNTRGMPSRETVKFLKNDVQIDHTDGTVTFHGTYLGAKWVFTLQRGTGTKKAVITAEPMTSSTESDELAVELTMIISNFFNEMVFEIDGVYLVFQDMMLTNKGGAPTLMISLDMKVRKFPSLRVAF